MQPSAFLHPFARPAAGSDEYTTIVRGEGAAVFDAAGNRYVDALAGLWFCHVGHGRDAIADAVADQLRTLAAFHCFDIFTNEPAEAFCAEVAAIAPMSDARVFLTSSGSEAVDTALKLARRVFDLRGEPHRHLIVTRRHGYHGTTYGAMSVQGLPANREGFGPFLEGVIHTEHDDLDAMSALFSERGGEIAAVIAEPVIGAGGVRPAPEGYLAALRSLCDTHGALLIVDEVICGFGRLGTWWGCDRVGVAPDMVTFAKGATSGYQPLGGVIVGTAVRDALEADSTFVLRTGFTYSGHPAACRAGLVNLTILRDEQLARRATAIGAVLGPALAALVEDGLAVEARGLEGIWAIDVPAKTDATAIRDALMASGVIVRPIGISTIALCPPLVIGDDDLAMVTSSLRQALVTTLSA